MKHVLWHDLMKSPAYTRVPGALVVPLGKTDAGEDVIVDLHALRHLLIAGVSDSGKSALVHSILNSLLERSRPERVRYIISDPKQVEFQPYDALSHLLTPVITEAKKTVLALKWVTKEAERRLQVLRAQKVRSIGEYHERLLSPKGAHKKVVRLETMPYVVIVLEDLDILMAQYPREIRTSIEKIAHTAKATGIHIIATTTRADAKTIPVALRELFPARLALHLPAAQSRLILDTPSAEAITEKGAAVFRANPMTALLALSCTFISLDEIDAHIASIAAMNPVEKVDPELVPADEYWNKKLGSIFTSLAEAPADDLYEQAVEAVREGGKASTSYLQRKLGIGYSRAVKLMDLLYQNGVIGPADGSAPREVFDEDED